MKEKIDVFLSYEHHDLNNVIRICNLLESNGLTCWYSPRDVVGDYASCIVEAIKKTKVFVLLLSRASSMSQHVLNEVQIAYERITKKNGDIVILPLKLSNEDISLAMSYYINRMHWVEAEKQGLENALLELKNKIIAICNPSYTNNTCVSRHENTYFTADNINEIKRLNLQRLLLNKFESDIYDKIAEDVDSLNVLDLGSADGSLIMEKLGHRNNLNCLLGIEYDEKAVLEANTNYSNDKVNFKQCNVESDSFDLLLSEYCNSYCKEKFNILNISMLLLHLHNPLKVLRTVRRYLQKDAIIIIKDIDDGFNVVSKNKSDRFKHAFDLCAMDPRAGYRYSGREIPYYLQTAGFRDIKLIKTGISTVGLDYDMKDALYSVYFPFVIEDFKILHSQYPNNDFYKSSLNWFLENESILYNEFMEPDFFFSLGFMLYTATK